MLVKILGRAKLTTTSRSQISAPYNAVEVELIPTHKRSAYALLACSTAPSLGSDLEVVEDTHIEKKIKTKVYRTYKMQTDVNLTNSPSAIFQFAAFSYTSDSSVVLFCCGVIDQSVRSCADKLNALVPLTSIYFA